MANEYVACLEIQEKICKSLGLDPKSTYRIVVDLTVNDVPRVYVQKFMMRSEVEGVVLGFAKLSKRAEIKEVDEIKIDKEGNVTVKESQEPKQEKRGYEFL